MGWTEILLFAAITLASVLATLLYVERRGRPHAKSAASFTSSIRPQEASPEVAGSVSLSDGASASKASRIRFESIHGNSVMEVDVPTKASLESQAWQTVELSSKAKEWFDPFLSEASTAIKVPLFSKLASSRNFRVVFHGTGQMMRAQSGDGFRSILVDKSNRVIEHGTLKTVGHLATNSAMLWECAAVLVGRKYLVDIDKKLNRISAGIESVMRLLRNQQLGRLQAHCSTLRQVASALRREPSFLLREASYQHLLLSIDSNANETTQSCLLELNGIGELLTKIELSGSFANVDPLNKVISDATHTLQTAALGLGIRLSCAAFSSSYLEDDQIRADQLDEINRVRLLLAEKSDELLKIANEKIDTMGGWFTKQATIDEKKRKAKTLIKMSLNESAIALQNLRNDISLLRNERNLLSAGGGQIEMLLSVGRDGNLLSAQVAAGKLD